MLRARQKAIWEAEQPAGAADANDPNWYSGDKSMNKGLISEDRSNKATLLLTIPCSLLSRLQRIYRSQCVD